jgi:hypothetical protein
MSPVTSSLAALYLSQVDRSRVHCAMLRGIKVGLELAFNGMDVNITARL